MAILTCERCGKQTAKLIGCTYCTKKVCNSCMKSMKKASKTKRAFICKSCWSNIKHRSNWKSA